MRWIMTLPVLALAAGCRPAPRITDHGWIPSDTIQLGADGEQNVESLTIGLLEVPEDSRCPLDATCVWEGNAKVALMAGVGGVERALALNTSEAPGRPGSVEVGGYRITLLAVTPRPMAGRPIPRDRYRVTLEVATR